MQTGPYRKTKNRHKDSPRFIQLFHYIYDSKAFQTLSPKAVRVYLELKRRYDGSNDNNLSLTYIELTEKFGFSSTTIRKAFIELEEHGLIDVKTHGGLKVGMKSRQCNIFGLSERWKDYEKN